MVCSVLCQLPSVHRKFLLLILGWVNLVNGKNLQLVGEMMTWVPGWWGRMLATALVRFLGSSVLSANASARSSYRMTSSSPWWCWNNGDFRECLLAWWKSALSRAVNVSLRLLISGEIKKKCSHLSKNGLVSCKTIQFKACVKFLNMSVLHGTCIICS